MTTFTETISQSKKYNLPELSIILHYRKDSDDREANLRSVLTFFKETFELKEIIIVNDDKQLDTSLSDITTEHAITGLFLQNDSLFRKSLSFNGAAKIATGRVLAFWDVDVIIDPVFIEESYNKILSNEADHVYPFNGTFIDVQKMTIPILKNKEFSKLYEMWLSKHDSLDFASNQSPGGCNLISKDAFWKINGYDDRFIGWGFEDTDFYERSKKANKLIRIENEQAICWHMNHDNAIRMENPYFYQNMQIYNENCSK